MKRNKILILILLPLAILVIRSLSFRNDFEIIRHERFAHISGEVVNEGVYKLDDNTRISDLVEMAGGLTKEADMDALNLSRKVLDEEKVYVQSTLETSNLVDINRADMEKLITLDGIGESTANKIIEYRNKNGSFIQKEEIMFINGIGESKFNKIKDKIIIK